MQPTKKAASAIDVLYHELGRKILRTLLKRNGGDLDAAEQVLQDTFIAAYKSFHTFHKKSTYFTWLTRIALNKLADYYRDQVNRKSKIITPSIEYFNQVIDPSLSPEESLAANELKLNLSRCLNLLPPEYRKLLQLKYYQELSSREISLKLHLPPRALEGKLYRAKKLLAKIYTSELKS